MYVQRTGHRRNLCQRRSREAKVIVNRFYYFAGFAFIALCGVVVVREVMSRPSDPYAMVAPAPMPDPPAPTGTDAQRWFASMKPYCNPVEVEVRTRYTPPPSTTEGAG